jgi:hypothetical protein
LQGLAACAEALDPACKATAPSADGTLQRWSRALAVCTGPFGSVAKPRRMRRGAFHRVSWAGLLVKRAQNIGCRALDTR